MVDVFLVTWYWLSFYPVLALSVRNGQLTIFHLTAGTGISAHDPLVSFLVATPLHPIRRGGYFLTILDIIIDDSKEKKDKKKKFLRFILQNQSYTKFSESVIVGTTDDEFV